MQLPTAVQGASYPTVQALRVGMRLEAVDRKNPAIVCVATLKHIDSQTGVLTVHFDGWGDEYDYQVS
jgi:hypothetical protein